MNIVITAPVGDRISEAIAQMSEHQRETEFLRHCISYGSILIENFPQNTSALLIKIILAMGLASIICLVTFAGLRMVYRMKLDQRREECRQLVARLLESRLGQPVTAQCRPALRDRAGHRNRETIQLTAAVNRFPDISESTAQGVDPSFSNGPVST